VLPAAQVYDGLKYSVTEEAVSKKVELDALVLFDRYAFLIECKAGTFGPSGRRGGSRMVEDLKKLVADPHRQAVRARRYIWETEKPFFTSVTGVQVYVDKNQFTELVCVTVHLEQLDVFTATLARTEGLGIFDSKELAWAVYLPDLRVVSEMIQLPSQFLHYLRWRLQLNRFPGIHSSDELSWLGYYFAEGPKALEIPTGYQMIDILPDYVHRFDRHYHTVDNSGQEPAVRPSSGLSSKVSELLAAVEFTRRYGYTRVTEAILDLAFPDRAKLENAVVAFAPNIGSREPRTLGLSGPTAVVQLRAVGTSWEDCKAAAGALSARFGGTAVVLSVDSIAPLHVAAWGIHK
jgi:hypothetical protein